MTKITEQDIEQMLYDLTGNDKSAKGSVDYTMFILKQYMLSEVLELIGEDVCTCGCDFGDGCLCLWDKKLREKLRQSANRRYGE